MLDRVLHEVVEDALEQIKVGAHFVQVLQVAPQDYLGPTAAQFDRKRRQKLVHVFSEAALTFKAAIKGYGL